MLAETLQNRIHANVRDFKASASQRKKTRLKPEVRTPCLVARGDHCKTIKLIRVFHIK